MSAKWTAAQLTMARAIWGMLIGTVLVIAGVYFVPHLLEGGLTRDELLLLVLFVGVGFLAASPSTAFQAIGKAVELWQGRKNGNGGASS